MRKALTFLVCLSVLTLVAATQAQEQPPAQEPAQEQPRTRTGKKVYRPHKVVTRVRKWTPPATPSPSYVRSTIIPYEASLWGVSTGWLSGRVACESRYNWNARNGQYMGLLQFGWNAWGRAWATMPKRVEIRTTRSRLKRSKVVLLFSDGSREVVRGRLHRQLVVTKHRGRLTQNTPYHAWAAVRGGARAMAGLGGVRNSEWGCR